MSAEQITPERIAEIREFADYEYEQRQFSTSLKDALDQVFAEVQRLREQHDAISEIAVRNVAEVQRLTEERNALVDSIVQSEREKAEARRSDAGRVEVPEPSVRDIHACLSAAYGSGSDPRFGREQFGGWCAYHGWFAGFNAAANSRLSPSPQPATGPFGCCSRCGGVMELSEGWTPSYGNPDNSGGDPMAWPYCPKCDASPQPSADVVVDIAAIVHDGGLSSVSDENALIAVRMLTASFWDASGTEDVRARRVSDAMIRALRSSTNHDSKETP